MRAYFESCLLLGRLLRETRYSSIRIVDNAGVREVHKRRAPYAPLLVALGEPLVRALDTGVSVLAQADWERREFVLFETLYGKAVRVEGDGTLVLPYLPGRTLATILADRSLGPATPATAVQLAVAALADFHARGFTHGDAMAENAVVDLEEGVARWFDFETVHEPSRNETWRRADDVRALLATCVLRTPRANYAEVVDRILDGYGDTAIVRHLATAFSSTTQRVLVFHLGQAPLAYESYREIGQLLSHRLN